MKELKNQPCFDKDGNFLGWFSRSIAVSGFVFCKDKNGAWYVLGSERGKGTPDFQGYWNSSCGYLDFGETTLEGIIRELREETGLMLEKKQFKFVGFEDNPSANRQNVTFRYAAFLEDNTIDDFTFSHEGNEKDEVGEIRWIPIDDIPKYNWAFNHDVLILNLFKKHKPLD